MPAYDYTCSKCGWSGTRYNVAIDDRDKQVCTNAVGLSSHVQGAKAQVNGVTVVDWPSTSKPELRPLFCNSELTREEIPDSQVGRVDGFFQMKAILKDGTKVPGHFGRAAKKRYGFDP